MGSIRAKGGRLFFDFRVHGSRCRELTALSDTAGNRRKMQKVLERIEADITLGTFKYASYFPGSRMVEKLARAVAGTGGETSTHETPLYEAFAMTWYMENEPLWRRSHRATIRSTLDRHLIPEFGSTAVGGVSKAGCLAFRAHLAKLPGRSGNATLSAKTINRIMAIHGQILAEAAERFGFVNPADRIKRLKQPRVDIAPFSLTEVRCILDRVRPDYRNYLLVRFFTGLRSGEINGLRWRNVDFERREILVRESIVRGLLEPNTKTDGSRREIGMSQPVVGALQAQYEQSGTNPSGFVFCNSQGEPIDLDNFTNRVWYPLLRHLDFDKRRPYQTRHTAATLWLASGENPEWVARQLGHANTEMLFKTYSRYVPNVTRSDGAAMERLLAANLHPNTARFLSPGRIPAPAAPGEGVPS